MELVIVWQALALLLVTVLMARAEHRRREAEDEARLARLEAEIAAEAWRRARRLS